MKLTGLNAAPRLWVAPLLAGLASLPACGDDLSAENIEFQESGVVQSGSTSTDSLSTATTPQAAGTTGGPSSAASGGLSTTPGIDSRSKGGVPSGTSPSSSAGDNPSSSTVPTLSTGSTSSSSSSSSSATPTGNSTSSSTPSASGSSSGSGGDFEHTPQFGLRLRVELGETLPSASAPRVLISSVESLAQEGEAPRLGIQETVFDYPISFPAQAPVEIVLPTALTQNIDANLGRSPLYAVALYDDKDADRQWSIRDGFIAANAGLLFYEPAGESHNERWSSWSNLDTVAQLYAKPANQLVVKGGLRRLGQTLPMTRFDAERSAQRVEGSYEELDARSSFFTTLSAAELRDLPRAFKAGPRPLDKPLRQEASAERWQISTTDLSSVVPTPSVEQSLRIPGVKRGQVLAFPIAGYSRPVGAAIPQEGEYLTADSTLISGICLNSSSGILAATWLDWKQDAPTQWIESPLGALYAAAGGIGPGWSFSAVTLSPAGAPRLLPDHRLLDAPELLADAKRCPLSQPAASFILAPSAASSNSLP